MIGTTYCRAAALQAMLQFIDPKGTPRIAYDDDSLADALTEKVRQAVGDKSGSVEVTISFGENEEPLSRQFEGVAQNISSVFQQLG